MTLTETTTRETLSRLVASQGIEAVLNALRGVMGDLAATAGEDGGETELYAATELVERAWMALPEYGRAD